jgi:hypothetical protein
MPLKSERLEAFTSVSGAVLIAKKGQALTHALQARHSSGLNTASLPSMYNASNGHAVMHFLQPRHFTLSMMIGVSAIA